VSRQQSGVFEVESMIDAAQKKLREARFFLIHLELENRRTVRNEPEAFDYFISAFVSAARSVTFALQAEEKAKYDQWFSGRLKSLPEEDQQLFKLMVSQRNAEQKQGGGDRRIEWEYLPVTELSTEALGGRVYWSGPPGAPPPRVGRPVRYLDHAGQESEALSACKRYYALLSELVDSFIKANS
jgi:hypothetical protein